MICELLSIQKHIVKIIINENKCFDFSYTEEELVPHNIAMVIFLLLFWREICTNSNIYQIRTINGHVVRPFRNIPINAIDNGTLIPDMDINLHSTWYRKIYLLWVDFHFQFNSFAAVPCFVVSDRETPQRLFWIWKVNAI